MEAAERELKDIALEIVNLCEERGLNIEQTGLVCEHIVECVCITEIITSED